MATTQSGDAPGVLLAVEARRLRYAFQYDPLLAMSASRVDPLPHQIEAVYGNLLKMPRIRFLLAHDPGAGKTIMAGLAVKELRMRGAARRVLVVVPGPLREQWRWELQDKFDETFEVVDRDRFQRDGGHSWKGDRIITSMDFAKRADILESLRGAGFDVIVVDEAHKMSAYHSGDSASKTRRYRLGEALSTMSRHLLFLTATPHKGDPANFRLLLDLLDPGYFAAGSMMEQSIRDRDNPLFLRRAKEDMVDMDGHPLFVPRRVETPDVKLSPQEKSLYDELSKYAKRQNALALLSGKAANISFTIMILQRRFASSMFALAQSLKRRREKLRELVRGGGPPSRASRAGSPPDVGGMEEMSEAERWREEERWEVLTPARNRQELGEEIRQIDAMIRAAGRISQNDAEAKFRQLQDTIKALDISEPREKVLIFTESRETMDYLAGKISGMGYSVNTIHGAMNPTERKDAERVFRDRTRIMVATEAAGEGINLQFCHIMINYDLPWNPNRLEQRMGRIHRYGQKRPVLIFNMIYADTREGQIMQILFRKLEEIKAAIGNDKVFDVIGDIVPGKTLAQMMLDATMRAKSQAGIARDLDDAILKDNQRIMEYLKDGLASRYIDRTALKDKADASRERQLIPEYTREFFCCALEAAGGGAQDRGSGLVSVRMPEWAGTPRTYDAVTFDKSIRMTRPGAELVTFGHPAFDAMLEWVEARYGDAVVSGVTFRDRAGTLDGHVVFCQGAVVDGSGDTAAAKLVAIHVDAKTRATSRVPESILMDLEPGRGICPADDAVRDAAVRGAAREMEGYAREVQDDRERQSRAAEKYGIKSADALLAGVSDDIAELLERKAEGAKVDLAIRNKRRERERYRRNRLELRMRMHQEGALSTREPRVVGIIRVVPGDRRDAERRVRAVEAAMDAERREGRDVQDARGAGHGFDAKSSRGDSARYVLVGAASGDDIILTPNQWLRARTLGKDCVLYADMGNGMVRVENPGGALRAQRVSGGYAVRPEPPR